MHDKLTLSGCTSGGCGAKIGPGELQKLLAPIKNQINPNLLVGFDAGDDAAVYALGDGRALVSTLDFFPPMVDDPYLFGQIAAANALSDVYAMGADPMMALNLVCFPESGDKALLGEILRGGADKVREAGAVIAGGHSIYDREVKYGLSVTGIVEVSRLTRNDTPRAGDRIILTKALGAGIILAAKRMDMASVESYKKTTASMARLNLDAAHAARRCRVSAATDVTGFGLLAHAAEMAGENATVAICPSALPALPGALDLADQFLLTAAGQRNRNHMADRLDLTGIPFALQELMFDPQTSGGLMIAVHPDDADALLNDLAKTDPAARLIGRVEARGALPIKFIEEAVL